VSGQANQLNVGVAHCVSLPYIVVANGYFIFEFFLTESVVVVPTEKPEAFRIAKSNDNVPLISEYNNLGVPTVGKFWVTADFESSGDLNITIYDESTGKLQQHLLPNSDAIIDGAIVDDESQFVWIYTDLPGSGSIGRYSLNDLSASGIPASYRGTFRMLRATGTKLLFVDTKGVAIVNASTGTIMYVTDLRKK
jgi:hypothetical protein